MQLPTWNHPLLVRRRVRYREGDGRTTSYRRPGVGGQNRLGIICIVTHCSCSWIVCVNCWTVLPVFDVWNVSLGVCQFVNVCCILYSWHAYVVVPVSVIGWSQSIGVCNELIECILANLTNWTFTHFVFNQVQSFCCELFCMLQFAFLLRPLFVRSLFQACLSFFAVQPILLISLCLRCRVQLFSSSIFTVGNLFVGHRQTSLYL